MTLHHQLLKKSPLPRLHCLLSQGLPRPTRPRLKDFTIAITNAWLDPLSWVSTDLISFYSPVNTFMEESKQRKSGRGKRRKRAKKEKSNIFFYVMMNHFQLNDSPRTLWDGLGTWLSDLVTQSEGERERTTMWMAIDFGSNWKEESCFCERRFAAQKPVSDVIKQGYLIKQLWVYQYIAYQWNWTS